MILARDCRFSESVNFAESLYYKMENIDIVGEI